MVYFRVDHCVRELRSQADRVLGDKLEWDGEGVPGGRRRQGRPLRHLKTMTRA